MITRKPPRCPHCKQRTEALQQRIHSACIDPWLASERARKAREKEKQAKVKASVERALLRQYRAKNKTITQRISAAQVEFNKFVRQRDRDKDCFVCGRPFLSGVLGRVQHAGHVRSRGAAGHLRFNENNCHGECEGCNGPHGAKPHEIEAGAIRRIGQEAFDALKNDNTPHKWTHAELIGIKDLYRAKRKELETA